MDDEEKQRVLEEWHAIKRVGTVLGRLLRTTARWVVGGLLTWEVIKAWWKS